MFCVATDFPWWLLRKPMIPERFVSWQAILIAASAASIPEL